MRAGLVEVLSSARKAGVAVGAFNVFSLEHAEAFVVAAEAAQCPVVLQISENAVRYHGSLPPIARATLAVAETSTQLVVVHLDHAEDPGLVHQAVELGFGSVMFDASSRAYADNVRVTAEIAQHCHAAGVDVEAELGEVGGKDGVHAPGARTQPDEAAAFVAETGVDALAVAVGSSHAMTERSARLDLDLISELAAAVDVPLVLHGSSGVPYDEIVRAVRAGMTKINIATHLNQVFTRAVRRTLSDHPNMVDSRKYLAVGRQAAAVESERLLRLLRGTES